MPKSSLSGWMARQSDRELFGTWFFLMCCDEEIIAAMHRLNLPTMPSGEPRSIAIDGFTLKTGDTMKLIYREGTKDG